MTRIAFIVPMLGRGGAERVVFNLIREFHSKDLEVICICFEKLGALGEELRRCGCRVECLGRKARCDYFAVRWLGRIFRDFRPDIVNVHSYSVLLYVVLSQIFTGKLNIVFSAHGLLYSEYFNKKRRQFSLAARFLSGFTAVDSSVAERHRQYIGWREDIEIIKNGIEPILPDKLSGMKLKEQLGIAKDSHVFLSVGNIRPEKGIEDLLDGVKTLVDREPDARFRIVIAGSMSDCPSYADRMQQKSTELGLSQVVQFIGHRTDMEAVYAMGDTFVLSSRSEGMPMVVLEALSAGLSIVATRVGGVPRLLEGIDGARLVDPNEPGQLADAMGRVMKMGSEMLRPDGEYFRQTYSTGAMADRYLGFFHKYCDSGKAGFYGL